MSETTRVLWLVHPAAVRVEGDDGPRFWKELIREGEWTNARAGFTLRVDRDRLEQWRRSFEAMRDAGIRVPVPWGHSYDPRDNAGFLEELELRDGSLWGLLHVPNPEDADRLRNTVAGVSVSIHPRFIDGSGREWGEVIEHVALTNYPVVPGQGDFIQASGDGADASRALTLEHVEPAPEHETPAPEVPARENADPAAAGPLDARNSELTNRLYQLELERAEREVDEALRLGKFTRPAAEALRQLVAAGIERKYSFDAARGDAGLPDVARLAREVIAHTPAGAAVDLAEHTRVGPMPDPSGAAMTEARAARLARENRKLAGV